MFAVRHRRTDHIVSRNVFLILLLLPVIIHLPVLTPWLSADPILWWSGLAFHQPGNDLFLPGYPGWADGNAGVTTQALGHLAAQDWLHGVVPWWNPYSGVGMPLAAEMQNSALFLPFVLLLLLPRGVVLLKIAIQISAGLATFGLLRALKIRVGIAALCSVLAELNGTFAWYSHGPIMPVAFLPLLLFGIERCRLAVPDRRHASWAIVAVAIAYSVYAGFPETAFLDGLFGLVFAANRLFTLASNPLRRQFAASVVKGGLCGLLLSAPASVCFLDYLRHAYLSVHADYSFAHLQARGLTMLVIPCVFGPPLFNFFSTGHGIELWWGIGGYIGLPLLILAVRSLFDRDGREFGLRVVLGAWVIASFAKAVGLPFAANVWDMIPFVRRMLFPVYITPSWEFAAIVLAAFTLDEWASRVRRRRTRDIGAFAIGLVLAGIALWLAWPEIIRVAPARHYILVAAPLTSLTVITAVAAFSLVSGGCTARRLAVLSILVGIDASAEFAAPLLSSARNRPIDNSAIAFLREHLGLQRFYSVSVFEPNYGAYEGLASVNHNGLPVPQDWVDYLHQHVNPTMDGVTFFGDRLRPGNPHSLEQTVAPVASMAGVLDSLERLAVHYILVPHGDDPFGDTVGTPVHLHGEQALPLGPRLSMSASFPPPESLDGNEIKSAAVDIGTYEGLADGVLKIKLCSARICRESRRRLSGATDNALLWMTLSSPLPVEPRRPLTATITHDGGTIGVGIYLWPARNDAGRTTGSDGLSTSKRLPLLAFAFRPENLPVHRVYTDRLLDIFALTSPSPYDQALGGHCRLDIASRLDLSAVCDAPDRLVRRELFFPGWHVAVDGHVAKLDRAGELFQSVALPAGHSSIVFSYRSPFSRTAALAMILGLLWLVSSTRFPRSRTK